MTAAARLLGDALIMTGNLYRLVKAAEREVIRMPEAVRGFRVVFPDCIGRRVTVVAGGDGVMAGFLPTVVLLLHYVAVSAVSRIVAQVRIAFGIDERINADSESQPESDADDAEFDGVQVHLKNPRPQSNLSIAETQIENAARNYKSRNIGKADVPKKPK